MLINLLLVDDHAVVRSGLKMILEANDEIQIIGEAETGQEAIEKAAELNPDVILMDIGLPDISGIKATEKIKSLQDSPAIIALTIHEDEEYFFKMLEVGASGYVPKRAAPEELILAITTVFKGDVYLFPSLAKLLVTDFLTQTTDHYKKKLDGLTPREQEILVLIAESLTNPQIANKLHISPKTVSRHRENIMNKLGLHSRIELTRYAIRKGIVKA